MSEKKGYALRINADVLAAAQRWADDELRSLNAQIEYVLRDALQVDVEPVEAGVPEGAVALHPLGGLPQRPGLEAARAPLGVAAARDQPGALEHLQVA